MAQSQINNLAGTDKCLILIVSKSHTFCDTTLKKGRTALFQQPAKSDKLLGRPNLIAKRAAPRFVDAKQLEWLRRDATLFARNAYKVQVSEVALRRTLLAPGV